ncbi:MAG: HAD family hydrolase [bacterium]
MIKGIIFDLDDTLYPEIDYVFSGFSKVCNKISIDYGLDYYEIYEEIKLLFKEDSKFVFNRLLELYAINYPNDYIIDLLLLYRSHKPEISLYNDAEYILNYLKKKNYKLGLITDGYSNSQQIKIDKLELKNYFDSIIITDELGRENWKPSKLPYIKCIEEIQVEFKETVYIGDNVKKDFISANRLSMKTVFIQRENQIYQKYQNLPSIYYADYEIKSLKDIIYLFNME